MAGRRKQEQEQERPPGVVGYCRVSTTGQDLRRQEHEILKYANARGWTVGRFIEAKVSTRRSEEERGLGALREAIEQGEAEVVVCSELSRIGRSVSQIARLVDELTGKGAALHFVKEGMSLNNGHRDVSSKVQLTMFSLLAEIERDLISERTKAGLEAAKARGVRVGRPPGKSKLDAHAEFIFERLDMGVPQTRIAEDVGCTPVTLCNWLKRKRAERRALGRTVNGNGH